MNSCCASSQGKTHSERITFAARASSTRRLEDGNCVESECTQIAQFTRERQSSNVQQYSSSVQTTGVLKRSILYSLIQTPVANRCCASSQATTLPERPTFAARASSTRRLGDGNRESRVRTHKSTNNERSTESCPDYSQYSSTVDSTAPLKSAYHTCR